MNEPIDHVDSAIGGVSFLTQQPTRPTVHHPTGMVRFHPVRRDHLDDRIQSFPLTVVFHVAGELFWLMPSEGPPNEGAWHRAAVYDHEAAEPHSYAVRFDSTLIGVKFAPTEHCGYFRFTVPSGKAAVLLANRNPGSLEVHKNGAVTGSERFHGILAHVHGEFDRPVRFEKSSEAGRDRLAVVAEEGAAILEFRYGISFIDPDQARASLAKEIPSWNFEATKQRARTRWNEALGQVEVEGGTPAQRRTFYSALYRSYERRFSITESGRYYSGYDHRVHQDPRPFYVHNPIWDSYRALAPLHALLDPQTEADRIHSYVRMYEQSGWMPTFAEIWGANPCMNGNHAAVWFADAWSKGIRDFDLRKAYEGVRKNSLEATLLPWRNGPKCALDDFYHRRGYFPSLPPGAKETEAFVHSFERRQAVAVTLEHSYDDWCIAQLARAAGDDNGCRLMLERAAFYRNVFRQDKGLMWPKDAEGRWIEPFDPKVDGGPGGRDYFDENNAYTYTWGVPHDYEGLFTLMGGRGAAEAQLDQLFREGLGRSKSDFYAQYPDATGVIGQFAMGNEPAFGIPYIYNYLGSPYKTQKRIRILLDSFFNDTLMGMPGDEDGGAMSAFVVFSMMGFYPSVPGVPAYTLGSPIFDQATVHLPEGKKFRLVCRDNSRMNKYIQSVRLNGATLNRIWLHHAEIAGGGTLELQMGDKPEKTLGTDPAQFPPSAIGLDPIALAAKGSAG